MNPIKLYIDYSRESLKRMGQDVPGFIAITTNNKNIKGLTEPNAIIRVKQNQSLHDLFDKNARKNIPGSRMTEYSYEGIYVFTLPKMVTIDEFCESLINKAAGESYECYEPGKILTTGTI